MRREKKEERISRVAPGGVIALSLALCVAMCWADAEVSRRDVKNAVQAAVQAAAQTEPQPLSEEYVQLSDPLLVLVNDEVPLPEEWNVTPRMVHDAQVDIRMYDALTEMFDEAGKEEIWFWVASGYRSVEEQEVILERAIEENLKAGMEDEAAREEALCTIAQPAHSEHHTGLAVDLNDVSDNFEETEAYRWLQENGAKYGFIQRYKAEKAGITGIDNESWHYRYVGVRHAKEMERLDMCLEEYVVYLKKQGIK